jgi:uncharacterized hydrophobic protein (TIGR00341 family)
MEKIEVIVFEKQVEPVENILESFNVPHIRINAKSDSGDCFLYVITLPEDMVKEVIQKLADVIDLNQKNTLLNNIKTEATLSDHLRNLANKIQKPKKIGIVIEELFPLTEPFIRLRKDYFVMLWIAAIVSMSGLFANSPAIVIGAMLISPILGPITALSLNSTLGRDDKVRKSLLNLFLMVITIMVLSAIITTITSQIVHLETTPEIQSRADIHATDVIISILLGVAGGIAMTSTIPGSLVGVAIAASLVPPAVVTGIGLSFLNAKLFTGSLLLVISNVVGLLLGSMIVFIVCGVTPRKYYDKEKAHKYMKKTIITFTALSILLGAINFIVHRTQF